MGVRQEQIVDWASHIHAAYETSYTGDSFRLQPKQTPDVRTFFHDFWFSDAAVKTDTLQIDLVWAPMFVAQNIFLPVRSSPPHPGSLTWAIRCAWFDRSTGCIEELKLTAYSTSSYGYTDVRALRTSHVGLKSEGIPITEWMWPSILPPDLNG